jgi:hypothetical protein
MTSEIVICSLLTVFLLTGFLGAQQPTLPRVDIRANF